MRRPAGSREAAAGAFYSFPIWLWHWASPRRPPRALGPGGAAAAAAARGQQETGGDHLLRQPDRGRGHGLGPVLTPGMIAHFTRTVEVLLP
jgi:hypothetical protein